MVHADNSIGGGSLYSPEIHHSETLINRTAKKIESEPDYARQYFKTALNIWRAERATSLALLDLEKKLKSIDKKLSQVTTTEEYTSLNKKRNELQQEKEKVIKYRDETLKPARKKIIDPNALYLSKYKQKQWQEYKHDILSSLRKK